MLIITIQFNDCTKNYDYVLDNPNNYDINFKKNIKIIRGIKNDVPYYSVAHIVKVQSTDTIPAHVHTKLLAGENNQLIPGGLNTTIKPTTSTTKKTVVPKPNKTFTTPIRRDYKKLERLYNELKALNHKLSQVDSEKEKLKFKILDYNLEQLFKNKKLPCTNLSGIKTQQEADILRQQIERLEAEKQSICEQKKQQLDRIDDFWR